MVVKVAKEKLPTCAAYEFLEKIAAGSMAAVYKARRRATGELVAIKVPFAAVADNPVLFERFQEEYRVGSSLRHPNIVQTLELFRDGGTYFLVMEFIDGPDLWQRIEQEGRLDEEEATRIIVQAAEGLHEAHRQGVIHRDVKPDNILLTSDGRAKLGDLGLIKDLEANHGLTLTNKGLGTPNFIAPEQFCDAKNADVRCDVYGLGATLYMAVTGELPFDARSLGAMLKKKQNNELTPPRQLVPDLTERIEWAIRRAVQADPQPRYASCQEFIRALTGDTWEPGIPPASPAGAWTGVPRPAGVERRRSVRYPCTVASVCDLTTSIHPYLAEVQDHYPATLQNLSVGGIGLLLSRRFEPGTIVSVQLSNPERSYRRSLEMTVTRVSRGAGGQWFVGGTFRQPLARQELRKLL